jgi:hypothetical protein
MLAIQSRRAARAVFNLTRELILILAVGVLGGQLLIALNGGKPIGTAALAATNLPAQPVPRIASLELDLDPRNPTEVRSVYLELEVPDNTAPEHLRVSLTPANPEQYDCHIEMSRTWHCPTPGLRVVEFDQVVVFEE